MFRRTRRSPIARFVARLLAGLVLWTFGPAQLGTATADTVREELVRRRGTARRLTASECRAIRGRFSGSDYIGPPRAWQFNVTDLGGYGQVTGGNQFIDIPVLGYAGKGAAVDFHLYYSSGGTATGTSPQPPIASGWRHSYYVYLQPGDVSGWNVFEGDGSVAPFTQNMDGSFTPPTGNFDTLTQNPDLTLTLTRKLGTKLNFDSSNRLASIVDLNGNTTSIAYGANGQVSTVTDAAGRVLTLSYNGSGLLATITDPANRQFTLTYDANNHLQRITYPAPTVSDPQPYFEFVSSASRGDITSFRNRRASLWSITYDSSPTPKVSQVADPNANTLGINYTTNTVTREDGTQITWGQDASTNKTSQTLPADAYHAAQTESWTYDSQHNVLSRTTPRGNLWEFTYDSKGNTLTVEDPVTRLDPNVVKQTYTYTTLNRVATATDARNNQTSFSYDTAGNLTREVDPLLYQETHTYSTAGLRLTTTDKRGKLWQFGYDSYGNLTSTKDPLLNTTTTTRTILGWPTSVTTATGQTDNFTNDNLGRRTRITHASDSSYVATTYDAENAVLSVADETGRTNTTTINAMGWVSSVSDGNNNQTTFGYNAVGVRTSLTNARNKTTTFTVDNAGRVSRTDYPDLTHEQATYNADGAVATRTDGRNNTVTLGYDTVGRLTSITYPTGTNTSYSYLANDWRSQMVDRTGTYSWTYNARGEVTQLVAPQGTIAWGYDAAGNRSSVQRTGVSATSYSYDDASRLTSLTNGFAETTSFTLDAMGRITQQNQANGTKVVCVYDTGRGWLNSIEHRKADNTVLAHYDYTRNLAGKITTASQPSVHSVSYTYDNAWQLTHEVRTGTSAYDISYTYDPAGNRLTKVQGGVTDTYTYGDNNQLLSTSSKSFQYDNDGNLTSVTTGGQTTSLTWDYNDKCTGITYPGGATNSFVTNDLGKRVSKSDSSGTTTYLFDGDNILADSRADYTQGGVTGLISERAGSTSKYYHGDQLGSTRGITDSTQAVSDSREYDSFGLTIASTGSTATPYKFAGGGGYQADADSGLMLLRARYYDPSVGRFISRDPIGYEGGLNLYAYCENDPIDQTDGSGQQGTLALPRVPAFPGVPPWLAPATLGGELGWMAGYNLGRWLRQMVDERAGDRVEPIPIPRPRPRPRYYYYRMVGAGEAAAIELGKGRAVPSRKLGGGPNNTRVFEPERFDLLLRYRSHPDTPESYDYLVVFIRDRPVSEDSLTRTDGTPGIWNVNVPEFNSRLVGPGVVIPLGPR
jgi:RHS repeat-associated protein